MSEPTTSITDSDMTMNNNTTPDQPTTQQTNNLTETQDDDQTMTPRRSSRRKKAPKMLGSPNHNDNIDELQHYHNNKNAASHRSVPHSVESSTSSSTGSSLTITNHYNNSISINNTINPDEESTTQITSSAKERFVSSRGRGRSKANASNASNRRSRKQKIVLDALPIDAAKSFVNSGPQPDVPDIHLMSPNSKQAYEKNKRLPMKLRGKGTHGNITKKVGVQVLEGFASPEHIEHMQSTGHQFSRILTTQARRFCVYEWFYPTIEQPFWSRNDFIHALQDLRLDYAVYGRITKSHLGFIRSKISANYKIRRFSRAFLRDELAVLKQYQNAARSFNSGTCSSEDEEILQIYDSVAPRLSTRDRVCVLDTETYHTYPATIQSVEQNSYFVDFDDDSIASRSVPDTIVMFLGTIEPVRVNKRPYSSVEGSTEPGSPRTPQAKKTKMMDINQPGCSPIMGSSPNHTISTPGATHLLQSPPRTKRHSPTPMTPTTTRNMQHGEMDTARIAHYIYNINFKSALVQQLAEINSETSSLVMQGRSSLPGVLGQRCAFLFVQLKKVNSQLEKLEKDLEQIFYRPRSRPFETPRSSLQSLFQEDVIFAKEHVAKVSHQVMLDLIRDVTNKPLPVSHQSGVQHQIATLSLHEKYEAFHKRIEKKVRDCVAFLYHLRTCVINDSSLSQKEIELTLNAATMALKTDSQEASSLAIYQEIQSYINILLSQQYTPAAQQQ